VNPSLLAPTAVMLLLPQPKRLMLGYLLGAYTSSIASGLAIVFSLHGSSTVTGSTRLLSPSGDIAVGVLVLAIAITMATGRDAALRRWRARRKEARASNSPAK
jgi:Sap, sulfolipid-1-addressing protein